MTSFFKKSPREVLYSGTILHRGMSSLPLQDLDELHLKKKQKNKKKQKHKTCETPSKNKTEKFKESDLKYEPYPKASFPTLSVNFSKFIISDKFVKTR